MNILSMLVTLDTSHLEMSQLNELASRNIPCMLTTLDTSQSEISALNDLASINIKLISVTLDTSHPPIDPYELREQSPSGDKSRHLPTARFNSD